MALADFLVIATLMLCFLGVLIVVQTGKGGRAVGSLDGGNPLTLIYQGGILTDTTAPMRISGVAETVEDLAQLIRAEFPKADLARITEVPVTLSSEDKKATLQAERFGDTLRVTFTGNHQSFGRRVAAQLGLLQQISHSAPQLMWRTDQTESLIWANQAYRDLAAELGTTSLFPTINTNPGKGAQLLQATGDATRWFEVTSATSDGMVLHIAAEATALIRADRERRDFVKTLGKTFADLSTGLAIFDKSRQLKMFNPALLELSKLPFAFLSGSPAIDTFFDRLRELRMMPEPKDYLSWREQFTALEKGAMNGTYCENWALPDGQTLRVTGRPHPDGAFALLFEDISAELSLTRRFRTEIETGQAVLDSMADALAVFTRAGTLVMSNTAYEQMWGQVETGISHRALEAEMTRWEDNAVRSSVWSEFRQFTQQTSDRAQWDGDFLLLDGRPLQCRATALDGGMTLVRFVTKPVVKPVIQHITRPLPGIRAGNG